MCKFVFVTTAQDVKYQTDSAVGLEKDDIFGVWT